MVSKKENQAPAEVKPEKAPQTAVAESRKPLDTVKEATSSPSGIAVAKPEVPTSSRVATQDPVEAPKSPVSPKRTKSRAPSLVQPATKGHATVQASDAKATPSTPTKVESKQETNKRKHPGKLDITAATNNKREQPAASMSISTPSDVVATPSKARAVAQTPSSMSIPPSPSTGSIASPVVKSAPRTLRVVQTPKTETPPPAPIVTTALPIPGLAKKQPSRQPSVASINPPGTPSSEQVSISDNLSMTSASQSRANSPPPTESKVGSAPVRAKTKSQMKKERQERAKTIEEEKVQSGEVSTVPEEPAQEAIVSRKKKARKEKEPKAPRAKTSTTADTTPTASRPSSPGPTEKAAPVQVVKAPEPKPPTPVKPHQPVSFQSPHEPSPPPTPTLNPAQLIADLKALNPELQKAIDGLMRTANSAAFKSHQPISPKDLTNPASWKANFDIKLTKDEVDALLKGTVPAIQYGGEGGRHWDRGMVTPSGAHIRALTDELERRFLELEKMVREMPEELRFHPSKPQNETKFPTFDLEALHRQFENANARGVSVMEQMVQDGNSMKKGAFLVDEASKYINEFVMPPATPPPSGGPSAARAGGQSSGGAAAVADGPVHVPSVDIAERQLNEARRQADEKEGALKRIIKKNRKILGL